MKQMLPTLAPHLLFFLMTAIPAMRFSDEAVGHERFASIDTVRDGGLKIESEFQSDVRGRFRTYFYFTISDEGKIAKLEIGQA
jgi:hypothetical protein